MSIRKVIRTASGAVYELDEAAHLIRRVVEPTHDNPKRRDGDWLKVQGPVDPTVGWPMRLVLEPLSESADVTLRTTTAVVSVNYAEEAE